MQAVFLYCWPDCPSCLAHLNSISWATWANWAAINKCKRNVLTRSSGQEATLKLIYKWIL